MKSVTWLVFVSAVLAGCSQPKSSTDDPEPRFGRVIGIKPAASPVVVEKIYPHSPAADAGLKLGDVIVAVDGVQVGHVSAFVDAIESHAPGDTVQVSYRRDGKVLIAPIAIGLTAESFTKLLRERDDSADSLLLHLIEPSAPRQRYETLLRRANKHRKHSRVDVYTFWRGDQEPNRPGDASLVIEVDNVTDRIKSRTMFIIGTPDEGDLGIEAPNGDRGPLKTEGEPIERLSREFLAKEGPGNRADLFSSVAGNVSMLLGKHRVTEAQALRLLGPADLYAKHDRGTRYVYFYDRFEDNDWAVYLVTSDGEVQSIGFNQADVNDHSQYKPVKKQNQ